MKSIDELLHNLSDSERSRLLYLISALQTDPKNSQNLINVVRYEKNSDSFNKIINELQNSSNITLDATILRKKML